MRSSNLARAACLAALLLCGHVQAQYETKTTLTADQFLALAPERREAFLFQHYYLHEDYDQVIAHAKALAAKGDALGKYWVGVGHYLGYGGLARDQKLSGEMIRPLVDTVPEAKSWMAQQIYYGFGGEKQDKAAAMEMHKQNAPYDQHSAAYVGQAYLDGTDGFPKDEAKALEIFTNLPGPPGGAEWASVKAALIAKKPEAAAQIVNANLPEPLLVKLFNLLYFRHRAYVAMRPVVEAYAAKGSAEGQAYAGKILTFGRGVPADPTKGIVLIQQAAAAGHPNANLDLANLYMSGQPYLPKDEALGLKHARAAAGSSNVGIADPARLILARATLDGRGGETRDVPKAVAALKQLIRSEVPGVGPQARDAVFEHDPDMNGKNLFAKVMGAASRVGFLLTDGRRTQSGWDSTGDAKVNGTPVRLELEMMVFKTDQKPKLFVYFRTNEDPLRKPLQEKFLQALRATAGANLRGTFDPQSNILGW